MHLTDYTDYALRVLMYLAANPGQLVTTRQVAEAHGISHNHLTKIVHQLGQHGILSTSRGRSGGIQLAIAPEAIMLGSVIRLTEPDFAMVACYRESSSCQLAPDCKLRGMLAEATRAYLDRLDRVPLAALLSAPNPVLAA